MNLAGLERHHLVLTGLMGVGKSTTARLLAERRNVPCFDSDEDLEQLFGATGRQLAHEHGVDELHRLESAVLLDRLVADEPAVISAAAWVVEDARCREALARRARVVVLDAPIDTIVNRAMTGEHRRRVGREGVRALSERRAPLFAQVGDLIVDATQPPAAVVDTIEAWLAAEAAG